MIVRARWVLPIDRAPIDNGWIEVRDQRIVGIGSGKAPGEADDLGDVALMPGLVNAHTHLELSWMAGLVPPAESMDAWIRTLLRVRREGAPGGESAVIESMARAAVAMRAAGTALVGDISNTLLSPPVLAEAGLDGVVFHELLGFNVVSPAAMVQQAKARLSDVRVSGDVRLSVVAHAPYSGVARALRRDCESRRRAALSVHLAESSEEIEFLRTGKGPIRSMLETIGVWTGEWTVPNCGPVEYLSRVGYLRQGTLVVHGVHLTDDGLDQLRNAAPCWSRVRAAMSGWAPGRRALAFLFVRRADRHWHRQSGVGGVAEPVRRDGGDAPDCARGVGRRHPGQRHAAGRDGARLRRRLRHVGARQARGDRGRGRAGLLARCGRISGRWRARGRNPPGRLTVHAVSPSYLGIVRPIQPFGVRVAVRARRRAARHAAGGFDWSRVIWIVACMVAARSAAMGFNRVVDARIDARNPRTAMRELPAGRMSTREAWAFVIISSLVFVACTIPLGRVLPGAVARRARHRVLVFARETRHIVHAGVSWPCHGRRAHRRLAGGRR
jgi:hypothetical protein